MKKIFTIFAALLFAGSMMADVTVSKSVHDLYPDDANGNQRGTLYSDAVLSISVNTDGNNGKVYSNGTEWRLYESANAVMKVEVKSGTIKTITFEYGYSQAGVLNYGSTVMTSKEAVTVNAAKAEFTVTHSSGDKKGIINIKSFTVVYGEGGSQDYCHVTSTKSKGGMVFNASQIEEQGTTKVILALVSDPEWLKGGGSEPATDGMGLGIEFTPKISRTDLRGKYDLKETDYVKEIYILIKDGTFEKYAPKSGWFTILANEDEDGYDFEYELVVTVEGSDHTLAGNVYGICDDKMNFGYCHLIGSESSVGALSDMKVSDIYENSGVVIIGVATSSNYLAEMGDGVMLTFGLYPKVSRQDLRGDYTSDLQEALVTLTATDGEKTSTLCGGTFTVSLNANKTTYDIAYDLKVIVDSQEQPFSGKIKGICDSEMNIPTAIENIPAAKVNTNKVIRNGHLFIEHEGHIYNANGIQVQ